ncbi:hypothetical protein Godav_003150 [Gossypium davidsonii]|uniref:BHLH domain-containing protein n=2 Tax=Gossypium TaxID=3633 RepID=A0A7J8SZ92_GOSDV|nr:hypothetical protein [Gossypium davidsonii]
MEDPNLFNDQWDNMNSVDGLGVFLVQEPASFGDNLQHYEASSSSHAAIDRPQKQLKITNGCNSCKAHTSADIQSSFSPNILPFSSSNHSPFCHRISGTKDHTMAERKRREKLNQMFIALSALVPGLKKVYVYI